MIDIVDFRQRKAESFRMHKIMGELLIAKLPKVRYKVGLLIEAEVSDFESPRSEVSLFKRQLLHFGDSWKKLLSINPTAKLRQAEVQVQASEVQVPSNPECMQNNA